MESEGVCSCLKKARIIFHILCFRKNWEELVFLLRPFDLNGTIPEINFLKAYNNGEALV
jgi:hypothetical protein